MPENEPSEFDKKLLKFLIKLKLASDGPIEVKPPLPPPKLLTGRNLWLFRAWLYLPVPCVFLSIIVYQAIRLPESEAALTFRVIILAVLTFMTSIIVRYERKNGLHFPTKDDIESYWYFAFFLVISRPLMQLLENGHLEKTWLSSLGIALISIPVLFPVSIIVNSSGRKKKEGAAEAASPAGAG